MSFLNNLTSTNATAIGVGPSGSTNPTFVVDASTASAATGVKIKSAAAAAGVAITTVSSGTNENLTIDAKGSGTIGLGTVSTGNVITSVPIVVTSASANALAVGLAGTTNPALVVDASTASSATGIKVKSAAAAGGVALSVVSSGTNEALSIEAKGSGVIKIGGVSTGLIAMGRGVRNMVIQGSTLTALGSVQNTTPTAAQLLGGYLTHASTTGAGTATLDTGTNISTAVSGVAVGDSFEVLYANTGTQTVTITTNTGLTLVGTAAIPTLKNAFLNFYNTGANTWTVFINVSA